jgi:SNF2 family DNA or RNA helicase
MSAAVEHPIPISKTPAWRHQVEAFDRAMPLRGAMLAMAMGTGKSKVAIDLIQNRHHRLTVITCPKSVVANWPDEIERHQAVQFMTVALTEKSVALKTERAKQAVAAAQHLGLPLVLIINHESLWREPFASWLATAGVDCLVVDEIHRAKAPGGRFSMYLSRVGRRIPWRLGLTGTPMPHSPLDVYAQYRFLNPNIFGTSYARFRARFAVMGGFDGKQVVGYQNEREMRARFESIAYQADDTVVELPEVMHLRRTFALEGEAKRIYRELEREFVSDVHEGTVTVSNALTKLLRLQQITGGAVTDDDRVSRVLHTGKRALLADVLEDLAPREPVVVFARFHADLDAIRAAAVESGRTVAELSGRRDELRAWQDGAADVLACQIQSGGVGINLTRARFCVYYSLGFSLAEYLQSLKRTHRPGQTRPVTYVHLLAAGTVDERVYQALAKRQDVVESILRAV